MTRYAFGPWWARRGSKGNFIIWEKDPAGPGIQIVATVPFELEVSAPLKRTAAAAQLIAAAPELADELADFVTWAKEHRRQAKADGARPAIDAQRVARAQQLLKRVSRRRER